MKLGCFVDLHARTHRLVGGRLRGPRSWVGGLLGGGHAPVGVPALEALPADPVDFFETASSKPMTASLFTGST